MSIADEGEFHAHYASQSTNAVSVEGASAGQFLQLEARPVRLVHCNPSTDSSRMLVGHRYTGADYSKLYANVASGGGGGGEWMWQGSGYVPVILWSVQDTSKWRNIQREYASHIVLVFRWKSSERWINEHDMELELQRYYVGRDNAGVFRLYKTVLTIAGWLCQWGHCEWTVFESAL